MKTVLSVVRYGEIEFMRSFSTLKEALDARLEGVRAELHALQEDDVLDKYGVEDYSFGCLLANEGVLASHALPDEYYIEDADVTYTVYEVG